MHSATAEYMALFRALESSGPPDCRLFCDPYASRFLRPSLRAVLRVAGHRIGRPLVLALLDALWPGARSSGIARTRFIDDALLAAVRERALEQIVVLGAGFDCRAHRPPLHPSALSAPLFLEVDRPELQDLKRRELPDCDAQRVRYVPCDFESGALAASLRAAGFQPDRPTFFLWEGVTNYLSPDAIDEVLGFVAGADAGSVLLFTYVDRRVIDEPEGFAGSRALRWVLRRSREAWTFGISPARLSGFLEERGLRLLSDTGSVAYRARYLGDRGSHLRGYAFYRAAIAEVTGVRKPAAEGEGSDDAQGQC